MTNQDNGGMSYTEGMNITREGAEVPEDKTPKKISKDHKWLLYVTNARIESHNKAIDACIHILETHPGDMNLIPLLESLKNKPI